MTYFSHCILYHLFFFFMQRHFFQTIVYTCNKKVLSPNNFCVQIHLAPCNLLANPFDEKSHSCVYKQAIGIKCPNKYMASVAFCLGCYYISWTSSKAPITLTLQRVAKLRSEMLPQSHLKESYKTSLVQHIFHSHTIVV